MITLRNILLRRGPHILLENVNWTIYPNQRFGIVGANGSGKSSLFSLLLQQFQADTGTLDIPKHLKFAHVEQESRTVNQSALDFVLDGDSELREWEAKLQLAENQNDGIRIAECHEKLANIDAYTATARAATLLTGLGFTFSEQKKTVSEFSGGWRVRLNLAKALMSRADVLLLDEPTNHLDLDAVLWLEQWIIKFPGTLLLISHDRDFLDATINHIAHLTNKQLRTYKGNYSAFETLRASELLLQQTIYEKQQKQLHHLRSFVDRFRYKASKARQAQSRLKAIDRMELVCAVQTESPFQFNFKPPKHLPNPLLVLDEAAIAYGDQVILNHLQLSIAPKERIGILGPNGAGKSSLIRLLAGELKSIKGSYVASPNLKVGYFAQHQVDQLHLDLSALEHLRTLAEKTPELELRKFLGSFGFSRDQVLEPVKNFSGGEKSRLALALIIWQEPNLLLLDEPTNHLDLEMRQALSLALQSYEGTMLLVSHDRFLVRSTTDRLLLVAEGKLQDFDGDLDDYQTWLLSFRKQVDLDPSAVRPEISKKEKRYLAAKKRESLRPLLQKIAKLEIDLEQLQNTVTKLEIQLTDESFYETTQNTQLHKHLLALSTAKKALEETETAWLAACEERDRQEKSQ